MIPAILAAETDLTQILQDALSMGGTAGYVIAGVLALCIIVPLVLKAMGKSVPLLDPAISLISTVLKGLVKKPAPPVVPEEEKAKEPGVTNVVQLKDFPEDK